MRLPKLFNKKKTAEVVIIYKQGHAVPTNVTKVIFDASVIEIPAHAFSDCKQLNAVEFNDGVKRIGDHAFYDCTSLTIIKLPSTVPEIGLLAFCGCTNLREVVLNEGLERIGNYAFAGCTSLTIVKLPSTVTEVGDNAFDDCTNLKVAILNEGLQKIGMSAFWGCSSAFSGCSSLTVAKFPLISKRAKNLIDIGITEMEAKITANQYFEWRGGAELLVSPGAIISANWKATRTHLDKVLAWVSFYELREATTTIALAHWKIKIEERGAATVEGRDACRGEVPGPVKDAIIQYLKVDTGVDDNGSDDSSQYSDSSREAESGDY